MESARLACRDVVNRAKVDAVLERQGVMATIIDYLEHEFATFEEVPFNPVDSLILSEFCMVRMEGVLEPSETGVRPGVLGRISERFFPAKHAQFRDALRAEFYDDMFTGLVPSKVKELALALAASPRFRDVVVARYASVFDDDGPVQFAAYSFTYKDLFTYVGFRGTDTSFAGWREDFDMAYMQSVPAQEYAVRYLEDVAPYVPGALIVGGHSKGGNLAIFAAANASDKVLSRIERVYCHDGPGFRRDVFSKEQVERTAPLVHKTVPQDSVVGMLMETRAAYRVVHSDAKGIMQHDPFSWQVDGRDFVYDARLSDGALFMDRVFDEWLSRYSDNELRVIVDALFEVFEASGTTNLSELFSGGAKMVGGLMDAARTASGKTRGVLTGAAATLSEVVFKNVGGDLSQIFRRGVSGVLRPRAEE